ncbi:MAG TPA: XRE family transcriptional regulator [Firmicutes bacterium]|jgi:transcriptional regulator with XRE-family HTH domain|nr:XRE family transcriptional regulator [Bacillota bacterium]HBR23519.1 XRE family transcriptional regulator [Bacillota bacterium]HCF88513.1 XRE family transcriptional regulator [Bacillota bacterium]HCF90936.1 XRE family transcriptional regulator [Bacillota bacterium]HCX71859.1 XRE family transcriptional regulator [Bacillota bacterium]
MTKLLLRPDFSVKDIVLAQPFDAKGGSIMASLGERVKKIRSNSGISVRDLAAKVGVSASFIYQLEKDESAPSFSTLKRIAGELGTSVGVLTDDVLPENWLIVKKENLRHVITGEDGFNLNIMAFLGSRDKLMQPHLFSVDPGKTVELNVYDHEHDDLFVLIQGELEFWAQGHWYHIGAGEAAYFSLHNASKIRNPGTEEAAGVWVVSPPGV